MSETLHPTPLTVETFLPLVGETFRSVTPRRDISLELVEATPLPASSGGPRRDPFCLLFRAPADTQLRQGRYPLEHIRLGRQEIFLVPICSATGDCYLEAVFN